MSGLSNRKYLDEIGLAALWNRIKDGFSPRWLAYRPTTINPGIEDTKEVIGIKFESCASAEQKQSGLGPDIVVNIPTATQATPGLMSSVDKKKLDEVELTAENTVTIKGIQVNGTELVISTNADGTKNKLVNWNFVYDDDTNELQILDLNASTENNAHVLASVDMDTVLTDAVKKGFLHSAEIVGEDANKVAGTFLKLGFTTGLNNDAVSNIEYVYINVADLVDTYVGKDGIEIVETSNLGVDGIKSASGIKLKIASINERGGFVASFVDNEQEAVSHTDIDARTFGVGIGKNNKAIVTVPIGTITDADPSFTGEVTLSPVTGGQTTVVTDFTVVEKTDNTGHTIQPTGTTIKLGKETDVTIVGNAGEDAKALQFGSSFTVFKDITPGGTNNHTITKSNTTWILPQLSKVDAANTTATTQTIVGDSSTSEFAFTAVTDIDVNATTGAIQPKTTTFTAKVDILSIETSVIEALEYPNTAVKQQ